MASLVPAATDLLIGMGASDHLVAVSNYDVDRPEIAGLPRVGDYQNIDWERIHRLRPRILIIFQSPDRVPAGMKQRADALEMQLVNVRTETLEDIFREMERLGRLIHEDTKAARAAEELRARLDAVRRRVAGRPVVRTLIALDQNGQGVAGGRNFLNDLLVIAGGENVIERPGWPMIDREAIRSLKPDAVLHLLTAAPPHVATEARRVWEDMPDLPAVRNDRIHLINEWYTQLSGYHVAELAERFADALHPETTDTVPTDDADRHPLRQDHP